MKAKIILVDPVGNETVVATFRSTIEAFQAASLFQAICNTDNYTYYVDYHVKGKGFRRTQPDSLSSLVNNSKVLQAKLNISALF